MLTVKKKLQAIMLPSGKTILHQTFFQIFLSHNVLSLMEPMERKTYFSDLTGLLILKNTYKKFDQLIRNLSKFSISCD